MRFHFCAAFYVLIFMRFYDLSASECAAVYLTIGSVIALEMINTAVEAAVDLASPQKSKLAKTAKDCASGAVLIAAIVSLLVAVKLFWDTKVFGDIASYFSENIPMLILLIISAAVWIIIIFVPGSQKERNTK